MTGDERALVAGQPPTAEPPGLTAAAGQPPVPELPGLTVVAGQPTADELAALTAALTATRAARAVADRAAARRRPAGRWADRANLLRAPLVPGPGAWCRSARPH
jgi:acyl-CoA carboxylase epsilon subunit